MQTFRPMTHGLNIAQIGPWPPPWGGISVYVQRLSRQLATRGHRVTVWDTAGHQLDDPSGVRVRPCLSSRRQSLDAAQAMSAAAVHVAHLHLIGLPWKTVLPFALACDAVGIPLVISVHSYRDFRPDLAVRERAYLRLAGARIAWAFASGHHVADRLIRSGVPASRVEQVAPFVPPDVPEPPDARLPDALRAFIAAHAPIISAGAAALVRNPAGGDLYGFDTFAHLARAVKQVHPRAGFIFQLPRRGDEALYSEAMAIAAPIADDLLVHDAALPEASDLWAVSDLFVRPTSSDGDSVSVREALSLGTPTLASDAVKRPEGVHTYPVGDAAAAGRMACAVLSDIAAARDAVARLEQPKAVAAVESALLQAVSARRIPARAWRRLATTTVQLGSAVTQRLGT